MYTKIKSNTQDHSPSSQPGIKGSRVTCRGFISIDQEMEREIAMQRFLHSEKIIQTYRSFLLRSGS